MTKVMIISGSPRKNGNSDSITRYVERYYGEKGIKTTIFQVRDKEINSCTGCDTCKKTGKCVFDDDATEFLDKIKECDAVLYVSPVYYVNVPGIDKILIDRFYQEFDLEKLGKPTGKKSAIILTYGELPKEQIMPVVDNINFCLSTLGFSENDSVLCPHNNPLNSFKTKEDQQKDVEKLAKWLVE